VHGWGFLCMLGTNPLLPWGHWTQMITCITSQDLVTTQQLFKMQNNYSWAHLKILKI
jgi:hypothetical protein